MKITIITLITFLVISCGSEGGSGAIDDAITDKKVTVQPTEDDSGTEEEEATKDDEDLPEVAELSEEIEEDCYKSAIYYAHFDALSVYESCSGDPENSYLLNYMQYYDGTIKMLSETIYQFPQINGEIVQCYKTFKQWDIDGNLDVFDEYGTDCRPL